ncbi:CotS family spore coat protein [Cohnella sp. GCM10027633]|uniref:CotS family spore coat protein n=1 Tax=unclassified Cohnella TaxID=2636738 RepID=UPI0036376E30
MAREVMTRYEMKVSEMTLITSKPDKGGAIWKLETDKGPRSLKVLHREPRRSLFSVYAQKWLVEQGARVPALIETIDGDLYTEAGGKLWIVTDWIALVPASKVDVEGAEELVYGLGEFHRSTRGYVAPELAQKASRIHHWPKYYAKMIEKIGWFRDLARSYPEAAGASRLLSVVEQFQQEAREGLARFEQSSFSKMVDKGEQHWGLVHQDYGFSNGQLGPGGIWVIDLDGVSYDFPIRDLRKIITSMMDDMGNWDTEIVRRLIDAYHRANPIDRETFELLVIDMAFPNEFYKHIKEMIFDPVLFMNTELEPILARVLMTQESKKAAIADLLSDADNYEPGDYEELTLEEKREARRRALAERAATEFQPLLFESEEVDSITPQGEPIAFEAEAPLTDAVAFEAEAAEAPSLREEETVPAAVGSELPAFEEWQRDRQLDSMQQSPESGAFAASPAPLALVPAAAAVPAPATNPFVPAASPRRIANRRIGGLRRRKPAVRRRKPKLPARKRVTKAAVRSKASRKTAASRSVARRTAGVTKRKATKKRGRIAAKRA